MKLVLPSAPYVPSYLHEVRQGWDWDEFFYAHGDSITVRASRGTSAFLEPVRDDDVGRGVVLRRDGSLAHRLPSRMRWMWDGGYVGSINLRWQPGTNELPEGVLGHVGYGVVPSQRRRGYASEALRQMLPLAWEAGLTQVDVVTDVENTASQRVAQAAGGVCVEEFTAPPVAGGGTCLLWRIRR